MANLLGKQFTGYSQQLDNNPRRITDNPAPEALEHWLQAVDDGDLAAMVELSEGMEAKDAHLQAELKKRRMAVTALPWTIEPDPKARDQTLAMETAEFCQDQLNGIQRFDASTDNQPSALDHLGHALAPGLAVLELRWEPVKDSLGEWATTRLLDIIPVRGSRLVSNTASNACVNVLTEEEPQFGIPAVSGKFVTYTPDVRAGGLLTVTMTRALVRLWSMKKYAMGDWGAFSEVYGQPLRVAKLAENHTAAEATRAAEMLKNMGSDMWAVFGQNVELEFKEAARGVQPFKEIIDLIDSKMSILILGQTLTTDTQGVGSLALGRVHEGVRASLTLGDLKQEANAIRSQILKWIVHFNFPGMDAPVPIFVRQVSEDSDIAGDTLMLQKLEFMRGQGLPVDPSFVYESLGIPMPKDLPEPELDQEAASDFETLPNEPLLTHREVQTMLNLPRGRALRMARAGELAHIVLPGGDIRFRRSVIQGLLKGQDDGEAT